MKSVFNIGSQTAGGDIHNIAGTLNITQNSHPEYIPKMFLIIQQKGGELEIGDKD